MDTSRIESINQTHQHSSLSNKYSFIPTTHVLEILKDNGWFPAKATEAAVRKAEMRGFQKHVIRCRHAEFNRALTVGEELPEIVITNAHNGLSAFEFMEGLFRCICANQAVVSTSINNHFKVKHIGFTANAVELAIKGIMDQAPKTLARIDTFKAITLDREEQIALAKSAIDLRYDGDKFAVDPRHVLSPRRYQDKEPTLWNTFNVIQENVIKGGVPQYRSDNTRVRARAVTSISEDLRLNKALWTLTEEMARLKA